MLSYASGHVFDALRTRYRDNARKTLWFTRELFRILGHLESAGIKTLAYKGPVLAKTLYGDVTERQYSDLDILIRPEDVPRAKAALLALGHTCGPESASEEELSLTLPQDAATSFTLLPDEICWTCSGASSRVIIRLTSTWLAFFTEPMKSR